jgi:hypothetical protein
MLRIREEQIRVFEAALRRDFESRLTNFLRKSLEDHGIVFTEAVLIEQLRLGLREAESFGLRTEQDTARFLEIACTVLCGFNSEPLSPEARRILEARSVAPGERLERFAAWAGAYRRDLLR